MSVVLGSEGALDGSSALGTESQSRILLVAARLAVRSPNGCMERLAYLLDAVAEERGETYAPRLARPTYGGDGLVPVVDARPHYREQSRKSAARLVAGRQEES